MASSCLIGEERVRGNGNIKSENRPVTSFTGINVSGNFDVYVRQDSNSSARIEADENLMEYIRIYIDGGTLVIEPEDRVNLRGSKDIKVYISTPALRELKISGAVDVFGEDTLRSDDIKFKLTGASLVDMNIDAPKIKADMSGASSLKLRGRTRDFTIDGSGAVKARCFDLLAENVNVDISGAGSAHVFASVKLNVDVSGAGNIRYKGNAAVTKDISGAGSVSKEE